MHAKRRLTHWGLVTHICVGKLTIIGSDYGLSPGRRQAIIWSNAGILLFGPLETNFSEILIAIETFSFKKMHLKISSAKWRPFCLDLNVLISIPDPFQLMIQPPGRHWLRWLQLPCPNYAARIKPWCVHLRNFSIFAVTMVFSWL